MSEIRIQRAADAVVRDEYGCAFRRILPWGQDGPSDTGMGSFVVAAGTSSTPHSHEDREHFLVVRGGGRIVVDGVAGELARGDAAMVTAHQVHYFENPSPDEDFELVSVWSMGEFGGDRG